MSIQKALMAITAMALPINALAQTTERAEALALRGTHGIELSVGFLSGLNVSNDYSVGGVSTTSEMNGLIGSLAYSYWFADEWAVVLSLGLASADASSSVSTSGISVESAVVVPLLFGFKYKPLGLAVGEALRPYLYASVGPYFGFASDVRTGPTTGIESYSETALGSRVGAGMDLSLSRRFTLGFAAGYRLVSDFERRIGSEENHSSPEFSLSVGFVVGRGKE